MYFKSNNPTTWHNSSLLLQQAVQENRKIRETQEKIRRAKEAKEKAEREKSARQARQRALVDITTGKAGFCQVDILAYKSFF